jgi:ankyrin repeat protein
MNKLVTLVSNLDASDEKGNTALHYAVKRGAELKKLLKFGAHIHFKNKKQISPKI